MFVYFGTYTGEKSQGIYRARLDLAAGTLSAPELAATVTSPSFLALDPSQSDISTPPTKWASSATSRPAR